MFQCHGSEFSQYLAICLLVAHVQDNHVKSMLVHMHLVINQRIRINGLIYKMIAYFLGGGVEVCILKPRTPLCETKCVIAYAVMS